MLRKLLMTLVLSSAFVATSANAMTEHALVNGATIEIELPAKTPQVFSNFMFWTVKAICTVKSGASNTPLAVKMLSKTGSVNGQSLATGDSKQLIINTGDELHLVAVSGAKVELLNQGEKTMTAVCVSQ